MSSSSALILTLAASLRFPAGREGLGEVRGRPQAQVVGGRHPLPVQLRPQIKADEHAAKSGGALLHRQGRVK